jgi:hypothetical protein
MGNQAPSKSAGTDGPAPPGGCLPLTARPRGEYKTVPVEEATELDDMLGLFPATKQRVTEMTSDELAHLRSTVNSRLNNEATIGAAASKCLPIVWYQSPYKGREMAALDDQKMETLSLGRSDDGADFMLRITPDGDHHMTTIGTRAIEDSIWGANNNLPFAMFTVSYGTLVGTTSLGMIVIDRKELTAWFVTPDAAAIHAHGAPPRDSNFIEGILQLYFNTIRPGIWIRPQQKWFTHCALNAEFPYYPRNRAGLTLLIISAFTINGVTPPDAVAVLNAMSSADISKYIAQVCLLVDAALAE